MKALYLIIGLSVFAFVANGSERSTTNTVTEVVSKRSSLKINTPKEFIPNEFIKDLPYSEQEGLKYIILKRLLENSKQPLKREYGCTNKYWKTVGDFVALNIALFENAKDLNRTEAKCYSAQTNKYCEYYFYAASATESRWACGFRIHFLKESPVFDYDRIECIGSC